MTKGKTTGYFSGLNKAMRKIVLSLLNRDALCKLFYYDDFDPLSKPSLTQDEKDHLLETKIATIPTFPFEDYKGSFMIFAFDTFNINDTNPKFINQTFGIDIYCHKDLWKIANGQMRPFLILDEVHQILEDSNMFGIGRVKFITSSMNVLNSEMMGYITKYRNIDFDR